MDEQQRTQRRTDHLEKYEGASLVRRVLAQEATFRNEVTNFYGINHFSPELEDGYGRNPEEIPNELIDILSEFRVEEIDVLKLKCGDVRKDYRRWNSPKIHRRTLCSSLGSSMSILAGIFGITGFCVAGDYQSAILSGTVSVLTLGSLFHFGMKPPKGTNNEANEYNKLRSAAYNADRFMDEHYRRDFIKRHLSKENI